MPDEIEVTINDARVRVPKGCTVAVAMMMAGAVCRKSVNGEFRAPFCGMGICFECRARINGDLHQRTCQVPCSPGLNITTNE